jgi:MFS family permease
VEQRSTSLWNRSYALALGANFVAFFVSTTFALYPLWILDHGGRERDVGLLMGTFSVVAVVLRPLAGWLADRTSYRLCALVGFAALAAVVPCFILVEQPGAAIAVLRGLMGAAWALTISPLMALATLPTPAGRTAEALGLYGISGLLAGAVAPLVGEELVRRHSFAALFALDGALLLLAAAMLLFAREVAHPQVQASDQPAEPPRTAWPVLTGLVALVLVHGAVRGSNVHFIAPFARDVGIERISGFFVAFTAAALLTRFKLSSLPDRIGPERVAGPAGLIIAANCAVLSQLAPGGLLLLAGALGGLGQGMIFPALSALWIRLLGRGRRALALAVYATVFDLGLGLGLPAFGLSVEAIGYRWSYGLLAVLLLASVLLFMLTAQRGNGTGAARRAPAAAGGDGLAAGGEQGPP